MVKINNEKGTSPVLYTSPSVEVFELKVEGILCQSSGTEKLTNGDTDGWF